MNRSEFAPRLIGPWLLIFASFFLTEVVAAEDAFEPLRERMKWLMEQGELPSVSVSVASGGKMVFEQAYGFSDLENHLPAQTTTSYSTASVSKPITAVALMVLVEQGKIDLDRPINDYLGDAKIVAYVGDPDDVTVRRVANHTAGLPLHYNFYYENQDIKRPTMDESIRMYGYTVTEPGERWNYSNFGYGLLEYVIERVSGMTYSEFLEQEVFEPLGMTHSTVNRDRAFDPPAAIRYDVDGSVVPFYDFDHRGASAIYSSTNDLARFGSFFIGQPFNGQSEIINPATRAVVTDVSDFPYIGRQTPYGLGFSVREEDGEQIYSHGGGMPGVATALVVYPVKGISVAVAANTLKSGTHGLMTEIRKEAFKIANAGLPAEPPVMGEEMVGSWSGKVSTHEGNFPIELSVTEAGEMTVVFNNGEVQPGELYRVNDKVHMIVVRTQTVPTVEAARSVHGLVLNLQRRDDRLTGSATAYPSQEHDPEGSAISYWVELHAK